MFMSFAASLCEIIKINGWCIHMVNIMGKVNLHILLRGKSRSNDIFHWFVHQATLPKSLSSFPEFSFGSQTTEKREVSSAKIFTLHLKLAGMSSMKIRNNRGPKIEPWGTPASTFCHSDAWPFNTTLWSLSGRNLLNKHNKESEIP